MDAGSSLTHTSGLDANAVLGRPPTRALVLRLRLRAGFANIGIPKARDDGGGDEAVTSPDASETGSEDWIPE